VDAGIGVNENAFGGEPLGTVAGNCLCIVIVTVRQKTALPVYTCAITCAIIRLPPLVDRSSLHAYAYYPRGSGAGEHRQAVE
jgi:hypothetical protein